MNREIILIRKIYWANTQYRLDGFNDRCLHYKITNKPTKSKGYYIGATILPYYKYRGKLKSGKYEISRTTVKSKDLIFRKTYIVRKKQIIRYLLDKRIR